MANSKNNSMHKQSQKWHRIGIKKSRSQGYKSLKEVDPTFWEICILPRCTRRAWKRCNAMSACAEAVKALVKPKEIKPKVSTGASCKLDLLALLAIPSTGSTLMLTRPGSADTADQKSKTHPSPSPSQEPVWNSSSSTGSSSWSCPYSQGCPGPC